MFAIPSYHFEIYPHEDKGAYSPVSTANSSLVDEF